MQAGEAFFASTGALVLEIGAKWRRFGPLKIARRQCTREIAWLDIE
jgi:hypothetical protein